MKNAKITGIRKAITEYKNWLAIDYRHVANIMLDKSTGDVWTDIFLDCNEWKEYSSMRLLFIGTSQQKLKMKISKEIEEGNMEYYDGDLSQKEQAKKFRKDWKTETRATINSRITYGDYDYTYNNEEM